MKNPQRSVIAASVLFFACAWQSHAQRPSEVVKWSAETVKKTRDSVTMNLSARVSDGWHVYAMSQLPGGPTPLKISVPSGSPFTLEGPIAETKVTRQFDANFNMQTIYFLKSASFNLVLRQTSAAPTDMLPIDVRFQACSDRLCLPPYTAHLTATLKGK